MGFCVAIGKGKGSEAALERVNREQGGAASSNGAYGGGCAGVQHNVN